MLWLKKQAKTKGTAGSVETIEPAELEIELDKGILSSKLEQLMSAVNEQGGMEVFVAALTKKHELFAQSLDKDAIDNLNAATLDLLLETMFTVRRRLVPVLEKMEFSSIVAAIKQLLYGKEALAERVETFATVFPAIDNKAKRATLDFAAELLHFRKPEQYPLMARWVWDTKTVSGAAREFIRGNDIMSEIPLDDSPQSYESVRAWFADQLAEEGFYRDVPFLIDMLLAWAYSDYMRAMSSSMGLMKAEFGGKDDPTEPVKKLLGIDEARRAGQSRIKRETVH